MLFTYESLQKLEFKIKEEIYDILVSLNQYLDYTSNQVQIYFVEEYQSIASFLTLMN
jgi:hypothetical protein